MTEQTTQTAVDDAGNAAAPPAAATDANARKDGPDLDTLLSEFDTSKPKPAPQPAQPEPKRDAANDPVLQEVRELRAERHQEVFRRDMDKTIKAVRGDLDPEIFDDEMVEAYLDGRARKDPRLREAWESRGANPKQFERIAEGLARDFAKKFAKLPDKAATDDREAVTEAVRSASTKVPTEPAPDYGDMSDAKFREEKEKLFRKKK